MKKWIVILISCFPFFLQAQTPDYQAYWAISLHMGPYISGVPINLEKEMEGHGFRKWNSGLLGTPSRNAQQMARENPVFQASFVRVSSKAWSYQVVLSILSGHVSGFSQPYGDLYIAYLQYASSFLVGYYSKQRITKIAVGPSLHYTSVQTGKLTSSLQSASTSIKPGFAIETGFRFPAKKIYFIDFDMQYQHVGKTELGTYSFGQAGDVVVGKQPTSYLCFNVGVGLRFGILEMP